MTDRALARRWKAHHDELVACDACPRLVAWREQVAREKRAAFRDETYWGRPVPGFGDPAARVVLIGLAPAAHGANRTGRMFTGDRSGDWLYRALYETGFANQPEASHRGDGLRLHDAWVTSANRCAPPANKPTPAERDRCRPFLERELELIDTGRGIRVLVTLGSFGYDQALRLLRDLGCGVPVPKPKFGHGREVPVTAPPGSDSFPRHDLTVLTSYHPSQQNTFTGTLTRPMLHAVFTRARELAGASP